MYNIKFVLGFISYGEPVDSPTNSILLFHISYFLKNKIINIQQVLLCFFK